MFFPGGISVSYPMTAGIDSSVCRDTEEDESVVNVSMDTPYLLPLQSVIMMSILTDTCYRLYRD